MKTFATTVLALVLTLFAVGCGGSDPKQSISEGQSALGSGNSKAALQHFEEALGKLKPGDPDFIEAKMGQIEALIAIDATKSKNEFVALAKGYPDAVGQKQFKYIGGQMANGKRFVEAIEVTDTGIKRFGAEATDLKDLMARIKKEAVAAGDKGATDKLKGLGYL